MGEKCFIIYFLNFPTTQVFEKENKITIDVNPRHIFQFTRRLVNTTTTIIILNCCVPPKVKQTVLLLMHYSHFARLRCTIVPIVSQNYRQKNKLSWPIGKLP